MNRYRTLAAAVFLASAVIFSPADQPQPIAEFNPRSVNFAAGEISLQDALAQLQKQTGNVVDDRRSHRTNPKLLLHGQPGTFWSALDAIGKQTGIGFSAYQPDGGVALTDIPYRPLKTSYSSVFRFAVKRVGATRDDEAQAHTCQVTLDIAWAPRLQPLYLALDRAAIHFAKSATGTIQREKLQRQTLRSVAGASAIELDLPMKAPDRTVPAISALEGAIHVISAPKMLEFVFAKLGAGQAAEQEGVKVSVGPVKATRDRWTVEVLIDNPPGAILPLESYQSWMDNNRLWLEWLDPKTKAVHRLEPSGEAPLEAGKGTKIRYYFTPQGKLPLPPNIADGTLRCRTPNRVVAFTVPFAFRDLPLP